MKELSDPAFTSVLVRTRTDWVDLTTGLERFSTVLPRKGPPTRIFSLCGLIPPEFFKN
jgi:hypothetical protein